jgi:hypothetical protein
MWCCVVVIEVSDVRREVSEVLVSESIISI